MTQKTAVEWFLHQLYDKMEMKGDRKVLDEIIIEAFSMEKEQLRKSLVYGYSISNEPINNNIIDKYLNEKYGK